MGSTRNFNSHVVVLSCTILHLLTSAVTCAPIQGCSIQGMDLRPCFKPSKEPFSINNSCCKVLNKAVKSGYNCLCLLLGASIPPDSASAISLPLSNCLISFPPLTHCQSAATFQTNMSSDAFEPSLPPHSAESGVSDHPTVGNEAGFIKISLHRTLVMSLAFQAYIVVLLDYLI
ncbi:hypothetical protein LINGRAHAP2_LOCUS15515 [Linum grandiflorum]